MAGLIAIRRRTRTAGLGWAGMATAMKRERVMDLAGPSEHSAALSTMGLLDASSAESAPAGVPSFQRLPFVGAYLLESEDQEQLEQARHNLANDYFVMPDVAFGLPRPLASGNRVAAGALPSGRRAWPPASGIDDAQVQAAGGAGTIVAILDTGCDADHMEFANRVVSFGWTPLNPQAQVRQVRGFDPHNHGTHVAGIIGGASIGIAPRSELVVASVIESETVMTSLQRINRGLEWVLQHISRPEHREKPVILNMSLGFPQDAIADRDRNTVMIGIRLLLRQLVEDFDVLPVVAIGNDGPGAVRAPGYFPETLSVGAVDLAHQPAWFSGGGRGPAPFDAMIQPDVVGYGVDILSSIERDVDGGSWYQEMSGTSMATPYVSGIAALAASATGLQGAALRRHLLNHTLPLPQHPVDRVGAGLVRFSV